MNVCKVSVATEPNAAALGLRLRLQLVVALTGAASDWIDAPACAAPAASTAAWHIETMRAPGDPYRLRAVISDLLPAHAFIVEAFRAMLGRTPDPAGLAHYTALLATGPAARLALLHSLARSPEAAARHEVFRVQRHPQAR